MFFVSEIFVTPPDQYGTPLQEQTYQALQTLGIPYERVQTDEAVTMEDCVLIDAKLNMKMVKTLFLCNRQQTALYLFITTAGKPFDTKAFSTALNIPRVSFAPSELMRTRLGTKIGAATIFSALLDREHLLQIVIDKDILTEEWYGCSDGTTTGYMKVKTEQIMETFLPFTQHVPLFI